MKAIGTLFYSLLSAVLAAVAIQYFVGNWNEEYLNYSLSEPVRGSNDTWHRNIELRNNGVDPAINVKVYIRPLQGGKRPNVQGDFDISDGHENFIGGFERIRRKEAVLLSVTSQSKPLSELQVQIKSDRSIAEYKEKAPWSFWPWSWWPGVGTFLIVYIFLAIAIPARRDYIERARFAKETADRK